MGYHLYNLGRNNIGDQGMKFLMERQLPLNKLSVCNYLLNSDKNNIAAVGLKSMPNCSFSHLCWLKLSDNEFMQIKTTSALDIY